MAEPKPEAIHSFLHLGNKYLLSTFSVTGIMWIQLGAKDCWSLDRKHPRDSFLWDGVHGGDVQAVVDSEET